MTLFGAPRDDQEDRNGVTRIDTSDDDDDVGVGSNRPPPAAPTAPRRRSTAEDLEGQLDGEFDVQDVPRHEARARIERQRAEQRERDRDRKRRKKGRAAEAAPCGPVVDLEAAAAAASPPPNQQQQRRAVDPVLAGLSLRQLREKLAAGERKFCEMSSGLPDGGARFLARHVTAVEAAIEAKEAAEAEKQQQRQRQREEHACRPPARVGRVPDLGRVIGLGEGSAFNDGNGNSRGEEPQASRPCGGGGGGGADLPPPDEEASKRWLQHATLEQQQQKQQRRGGGALRQTTFAFGSGGVGAGPSSSPPLAEPKVCCICGASRRKPGSMLPAPPDLERNIPNTDVICRRCFRDPEEAQRQQLQELERQHLQELQQQQRSGAGGGGGARATRQAAAEAATTAAVAQPSAAALFDEGTVHFVDSSDDDDEEEKKKKECNVEARPSRRNDDRGGGDWHPDDAGPSSFPSRGGGRLPPAAALPRAAAVRAPAPPVVATAPMPRIATLFDASRNNSGNGSNPCGLRRSSRGGSAGAALSGPASAAERYGSLSAVFPASGGPGAVRVTGADLACLDAGCMLNDSCIDLRLKMIEEDLKAWSGAAGGGNGGGLTRSSARNPRQPSPSPPSRFHFFNSFFFKKLTQGEPGATRTTTNARFLAPAAAAAAEADARAAAARAHARVASWTKNVDVFARDFVFVPVHDDLHWSLLLICHPAAVVGVGAARDIAEAASAAGVAVGRIRSGGKGSGGDDGDDGGGDDDGNASAAAAPLILHLDSMAGSGSLHNPRALHAQALDWLREEWKAKAADSLGDALSSAAEEPALLSQEVLASLPVPARVTALARWLRASHSDPFKASETALPVDSMLGRDAVPLHRPPSLPKQNNTSDCGLFLLAYVDYFAAQAPAAVNSQVLANAWKGAAMEERAKIASLSSLGGGNGAGGRYAAAAAAAAVPSAPLHPLHRGHESRPGFVHKTWFRGEPTAEALRLLLRRLILQMFVEQGREAHAGAADAGNGGDKSSKSESSDKDGIAYTCAISDLSDIESAVDASGGKRNYPEPLSEASLRAALRRVHEHLRADGRKKRRQREEDEEGEFAVALVSDAAAANAAAASAAFTGRSMRLGGAFSDGAARAITGIYNSVAERTRGAAASAFGGGGVGVGRREEEGGSGGDNDACRAAAEAAERRAAAAQAKAAAGKAAADPSFEIAQRALHSKRSRAINSGGAAAAIEQVNVYRIDDGDGDDDDDDRSGSDGSGSDGSDGSGGGGGKRQKQRKQQRPQQVPRSELERPFNHLAGPGRSPPLRTNVVLPDPRTAKVARKMEREKERDGGAGEGGRAGGAASKSGGGGGRLAAALFSDDDEKRKGDKSEDDGWPEQAKSGEFYEAAEGEEERGKKRKESIDEQHQEEEEVED